MSCFSRGAYITGHIVHCTKQRDRANRLGEAAMSLLRSVMPVAVIACALVLTVAWVLFLGIAVFNVAVEFVLYASG